MVAMETEDEVHCAEAVRSCFVPSVRNPVAVNCCVRPFGMDAPDGTTIIDCNTGGVTVRVAEPLRLPDVAVIVAVPWDKVVAEPLALTAPTPGFDEVHETEFVRS